MVRNYVYVSYGISCWIQHLACPQKAPKGESQHLERYEIRTPKKHQKASKRYSVPEIKDRQYLQIIWEGKAKWYEIMSMFPTELAAESNT